MSVKSTVARTRSGSAPRPRRSANSTVSRIVCSWTRSSTHVKMSRSPGSSRVSAPRILEATYVACSRSHGRCRMSVGTRMAPSTSLTSASFIGRRPRVVGRRRPAHPGIEQRQRRRALRIRGSEQDRGARAFVARPQDGAFGADRIHDRADVIHPRLQRGRFADAVGQSGAPLVQHQHARELGHVDHVAVEERLVPRREDIADHAAEPHDIDRPVADDLVGDRDVAAPGVLHVGNVQPRTTA